MNGVIDKKLLSKKEAAEMLGVSTRTIERMMTNGELVKVKIRGCVRARLSEIKQLLEGGASA